MGLVVQERTDCITGQVGRVPMLYGAIYSASRERCALYMCRACLYWAQGDSRGYVRLIAHKGPLRR